MAMENTVGINGIGLEVQIEVYGELVLKYHHHHHSHLKISKIYGK